jgi:GAF domain-containing protein
MKLIFDKTKLANKILQGYVVVLAVTILTSVFCIISFKKNQALDERLSGVHLPLYTQLKDLKILSNEMARLSNAWIFQPNPAEKEKLKDLFANSYPSATNEMEKILEVSDRADADTVSKTLEFLKSIYSDELKITQLLHEDSLYSNDEVVDAAIQVLEASVGPKTKKLDQTLDRLISLQEEKMQSVQVDKQASYRLLLLLFGLLILSSGTTAGVAYVSVKRNIVRPIEKLRDNLVDLGKGKIVQMSAGKREDELGQMQKAMLDLTDGIRVKSTFAHQIGLGSYEEHFELLSTEDLMGSALLTMRDNLKKNAETERKRNWATQGIAEIGSILRAQNSSTDMLYDQILTFAVHYGQFNQGRLYILNSDDASNPMLELVSCYAFERKKFLHQKFNVGEGLVGQCVLESQTIYMTDIPSSYIRITSGLGDAPPTSLLIVPLKINDEVNGVLELASFRKLEGYEIEFIEKLCENIASAVSSVRINERTKLLLASSQMQTEEMRSQEEEMKQNMEELSATQEEMARKEAGYLARIAQLEDLVESLRNQEA